MTLDIISMRCKQLTCVLKDRHSGGYLVQFKLKKNGE